MIFKGHLYIYKVWIGERSKNSSLSDKEREEKFSFSYTGNEEKEKGVEFKMLTFKFCTCLNFCLTLLFRNHVCFLSTSFYVQVATYSLPHCLHAMERCLLPLLTLGTNRWIFLLHFILYKISFRCVYVTGKTHIDLVTRQTY